ncbi:hypothetical protein M427DRAFT_52880 [Gonapodya prolifera JEL478]|uniref:DUF6314 domain-containing protein n=1 Tax=Gonapodya prolifera (strain JEL478) TaxID=1344416 RepID=A0A139ARR9_GONPJ|nr:hypothetical protein M427DRAFT_52880 [Gonapodya prolifera JEL478]|eukprot:KXS19438.1 hypothetical protein M427DRAFT_52880 [Gonapodya prolifera JEL478]
MDHPSAKSVAHRVFRSLPGEWSLERIAVSRNNFQPGGRFSGSARFQPQANSSTASGLEYLYTEEGEFTFAGGKLTAKRHYVWRYDERSDTISVWFVRTDDHTRADYLYHEVEFAKASPGSSTVTAGASHLCVRDLYGVKYTFHISEDKVHSWRLLCEVKGPAKDYTLDSAYSRL